MPRPRSEPATALGRALVARRGGVSLEAVAADLGVHFSTVARLERGDGRPSYDTAVKLAAWLGWTVEQVMEASRPS